MTLVFGMLIVLASVFGGYVLSEGDLLALWQPFELLIIGGAAFGSFVIANPGKVIAGVFKGVPKVMAGNPYKKALYLEALALLYELFNKIRRDGLIAIESHVDEPENSDIFNKYPIVNIDAHVIEFICDYLRIMIVGDMSAYELDNLMDIELETHHEEMSQPANALTRVADSLPGFGIVAAVLGIVITMKSIGGPPEELGIHVAAALVGTFLGILLAYGFVAPTAQAFEHQAAEESKFYECLKTAIIATVNGMPPQMAVEFGRKTIFKSERPSFTELEERVRMT